MTLYGITFNSPEKCRLRKRIESMKMHYKKKIRNLQQQLRRKTDQVTTLKVMITNLIERNLLNEEQADVLQTFDESSMLKRLIRTKRVPARYDEQFRSFALTLHYYSPRAYEYVRSKFNLCLPHAKTITKWYGAINGKPGITLEALNYITQHVNNTIPLPYQLSITGFFNV